MKKRKILNVLMVLVILLIVVSGFIAVRTLKGPTVKQQSAGFEQQEKSTIIVGEKTGIVTVERKGIAYELDVNTEIKTGDILRTKVSSSLTLSENGKAILILGSDAELQVTDAETGSYMLEEGEVFVDQRNCKKKLELSAKEVTFVPEGATFTTTAYKSAYTAYVYGGSLTTVGEKINEIVVPSGKTISITLDESGKLNTTTGTCNANGLSDWQIMNLENCKIDETFCFTKNDLSDVIASREVEKEAAKQALFLAQQEAKEMLATSQKEYDENYRKYMEAVEKGANVSTDAEGNIVVSTPANSCTIEIRCDTILNNMDKLTPGKEGYVPSNGKILSTIKVSFEEGETVFDVLKRVCSVGGIQLEYSWTPMYNSYYIEGIHHLYEFDCGAESGWMYKVNGWFPNYGCSSYTLKDGDVIVWCYTCKGLGADVGGSVY